MNADNISDLPEWSDKRFTLREDDDNLNPNRTLEACKALYEKWREIVFLLKGVLIPLLENKEKANDESIESHTAGIFLSDAYMVGVKIRSSEAGGIYIIRMENAAIIRQHVQSIASGLLLLDEEEGVDEAYITVLRKEINEFRELFIEWVNTFEKDEFVDEWGLFI